MLRWITWRGSIACIDPASTDAVNHADPQRQRCNMCKIHWIWLQLTDAVVFSLVCFFLYFLRLVLFFAGCESSLPKNPAPPPSKVRSLKPPLKVPWNPPLSRPSGTLTEGVGTLREGLKGSFKVTLKGSLRGALRGGLRLRTFEGQRGSVWEYLKVTWRRGGTFPRRGRAWPPNLCLLFFKLDGQKSLHDQGLRCEPRYGVLEAIAPRWSDLTDHWTSGGWLLVPVNPVRVHSADRTLPCSVICIPWTWNVPRFDHVQYCALQLFRIAATLFVYIACIFMRRWGWVAFD